MKVEWKPDLAKQGRKTIRVEKASVPEHDGRFILYPCSKIVVTMWCMYDSTLEIQHYLNGDGWDGARKAAEKRISEVMNPKVKPHLQPKPKLKGGKS
jgi:hypothetical protein